MAAPALGQLGVEQLVAQGVAEGILKPRTRTEVARMAVDG